MESEQQALSLCGHYAISLQYSVTNLDHELEHERE
jgi:hypothetical protein